MLLTGQNLTSPSKGPIENSAPIRSSITKFCEDLQATTFSILFHPLATELSIISNEVVSPNMIETVWKDPWAGSDSRQSEMPDFR